MSNTYEITGTYGSHNTPSTVHVMETDAGHWYAVDGSVNVGLSPYELTNGVDVETIPDVDFFTASEAITSTDILTSEVLD